MTHYVTLGVPADADGAEIRRAYRARMREVHPDVGGSQEDAAAVAEAYRVLGDASLRESYDGSLRMPSPPEPPTDPKPSAPPFWPMFDDDPADGGSTGEGGSQDAANDDPPAAAFRSVVGSIARVVACVLAVSVLVSVLVSAMSGAPMSTCLAWGAGGWLAGSACGWAYRDGFTRGGGAGWVLPRWAALLVAAASVAIGVLGAVMLPLNRGYLWAGLSASGVGAAVVGSALQLRWRWRAVSMRSLREYATFGVEPAGAESFAVSQLMAEFARWPAARVFRAASSECLYTHAVVCGDRVVFVGGVHAPAGSLRWHGRSLMSVPERGFATEVLRVNRDATESCALAGVTAERVLVAWGDGVAVDAGAGHADVVPAGEAWAWLQASSGVDSERVVDQRSCSWAATVLARQ